MRRTTVLLSALVLTATLGLAACGDDGPGTQDARFEVVVAEPLSGAVLFPGVAITFSAAVTALSEAQVELYRAVSKGLLHKNKAARTMSRLTASIKAI